MCNVRSTPFTRREVACVAEELFGGTTVNLLCSVRALIGFTCFTTAHNERMVEVMSKPGRVTATVQLLPYCTRFAVTPPPVKPDPSAANFKSGTPPNEKNVSA